MLALLRLAAAVGAAANWLVIFLAVIITVFTLYVGIAMGATLRAIDPEQRALRYAVFRDLLRCFRDWWLR